MIRRVVAAFLAVALTGWLAPAAGTPLPYAWRHRIGVSLTDVATDDGGLTVVVGERGGYEYDSFLVAAFAPDGTRLWRDSWRPIRGEPAGTMGTAVSIGPDGGVYALGFGWHCRFGCESGGWFIRAYTRDGTLRWMRQAAGWKTRPRQSHATGIDTRPGGVAITGYEYDDDIGPTASWIRTYGLDGTFAWKTRVRVAAATDVRVAAEAVSAGPAGAIFVAGYVEFGLVVELGMNDHEPFVAGFNATGERRWTRVFHQRGDLDDDRADSIDARHGVLAVGGFLGEPIGYGIDPPHLGWLARLSFDGDVRWHRSWGASRPQSVEDVAVAPSGDVTTIGGLERRGYALVARTYGGSGRLIASQVIDPTEGSLIGLGISIDTGGASFVGTTYRNASLSSALHGSLWRHTGTVVPS